MIWEASICCPFGAASGGLLEFDHHQRATYCLSEHDLPSHPVLFVLRRRQRRFLPKSAQAWGLLSSTLGSTSVPRVEANLCALFWVPKPLFSRCGLVLFFSILQVQ